MLYATAYWLIALSGHALAKEMAPDSRLEAQYSSGAFMAKLMAEKEVNNIAL
jgi:hypothetical protein